MTSSGRSAGVDHVRVYERRDAHCGENGAIHMTPKSFNWLKITASPKMPTLTSTVTLTLYTTLVNFRHLSSNILCRNRHYQKSKQNGHG